MTTTDDTSKKIEITLSERAPVRIVAADWPVIASANWFNGEHDFQANYKRYIKVREHEDGRRIVYGAHTGGPGGSPIDFRATHASFLLAKGEDTARAIRRVAGAIGDDKLGEECIGDLPAEDL